MEKKQKRAEQENKVKALPIQSNTPTISEPIVKIHIPLKSVDIEVKDEDKVLPLSPDDFSLFKAPSISSPYLNESPVVRESNDIMPSKKVPDNLPSVSVLTENVVENVTSNALNEERIALILQSLLKVGERMEKFASRQPLINSPLPAIVEPSVDIPPSISTPMEDFVTFRADTTISVAAQNKKVLSFSKTCDVSYTPTDTIPDHEPRLEAHCQDLLEKENVQPLSIDQAPMTEMTVMHLVNHLKADSLKFGSISVPLINISKQSDGLKKIVQTPAIVKSQKDKFSIVDLFVKRMESLNAERLVSSINQSPPSPSVEGVKNVKNEETSASLNLISNQLKYLVEHKVDKVEQIKELQQKMKLVTENEILLQDRIKELEAHCSEEFEIEETIPIKLHSREKLDDEVSYLDTSTDTESLIYESKKESLKQNIILKDYISEQSIAREKEVKDISFNTEKRYLMGSDGQGRFTAQSLGQKY